MEKFKILIADDEASIRRALKSLLHSEGYEIHLAASAIEAMKILKKVPVDLILSDQRMPGMSGTELIEKVSKKYSEIICILITAYVDVKVVIDAINQGSVYKYILKPWDSDELKITVRRALEHLVDIRERRRNMETIRKQNLKLHELNERLEDLVKDRTAGLLRALKDNEIINQELELKVRELEARDQLLNHMLEVHTRDESLHQIAISVGTMIEADQVMIYFGKCYDERTVNPCFGWDRAKEKIWLRDSNTQEISGFYLLPKDVLVETLKKQKEMLCLEPEQDTTEIPYACLPIIKGEDVLGALVIANQHNKHPISEQNVQSLRSLLHYVSLVIEDIGLLDRLPDVSKLTEALEE